MKAAQKFRESEQFAYYKYGDDYYKGRNTAIMGRDPKCYVEGFGAVSNPYKANHRLASVYLQKIVDQKVGYLLGNGVNFTDETFKPDNYGPVFDDFMQDLGTTAAKKGRGWVYFYVDKGKLKMIEVAPEQITPVYDENDELSEIIRQYTREIGGKEMQITLVYDSDGVTEYHKIKNKWEMTSQYGHYSTDLSQYGSVISTEEHSFGAVPFVELKNNPDCLSDLYPIKALIDIYDIVNSDFANNIDDMQDAFFVIKNFQGDNYNEFLSQLKKTKAVKVGEDGDVTTSQLQIPTEARSVFLTLTDANIFKFAMAVDTTKLSGNSLTNVAIKAQFADLDLKTDKFESQVRKFVKDIMDFIGLYEGKTYDATVKFNRSMIVNEAEMIEAVNKSAMLLSTKTLLEAHPLVEDVEDEIKRKAEEPELNDMGFGNGEE